MNPDRWPTELDENEEAPVLITVLGESGRIALHGALLAGAVAELQEKGWDIQGMQIPCITADGKVTLPCAGTDPDGRAAVFTSFDGEWSQDDIAHFENWLRVVRSSPDLAGCRIVLFVQNGNPPESISGQVEMMTPPAPSEADSNDLPPLPPPSEPPLDPVAGFTSPPPVPNQENQAGGMPAYAAPPPVPGAAPNQAVPASGDTSNSVILSIVSLALSVVSLPLCLCCTLLSIPLAAGGAGVGWFALRDAKANDADTTLPMIALIIGAVLLVLQIVSIVLSLVLNIGFSMSNGF